MSSNVILDVAAKMLYTSSKRSTLNANEMQLATTGFTWTIPDTVPETGVNNITNGACGYGLNQHCYGKNGYNEQGEAWTCTRMWVG